MLLVSKLNYITLTCLNHSRDNSELPKCLISLSQSLRGRSRSITYKQTLSGN